VLEKTALYFADMLQLLIQAVLVLASELIMGIST
jgi:hypothetical protein